MILCNIALALVTLVVVYLAVARKKRYPVRDNQVIVVTGGVQGLGKCIVQEMLRGGSKLKIVIVDIR